MKRFLSAALKLRVRLVLRSMRDCQSGHRGRLVKRSAERMSGRLQFGQVQALKSASYADNKRHNLVQASARINQLVIQPGEIFSFWALVGEPSARKGYLPGRTLVNGRLQAEYGGGLCQLSGLIYYVALQAGVEIVERYPHSVDIYTDETRFTPLGSDATVVYGYKDLRVLNSLSHAIAFNVRLEPDEIVGELWAAEAVVRFSVEFETVRRDRAIEVITRRRSNSESPAEVVTVSHYRLPQNGNLHAIG